MDIHIGIQANCSEATMRILLDGQKREDINALIEKLQIELDDFYNCEETKTEWDGEKPLKEFSFYETSYDEEEIFGVNVLTIKGDAPYNCREDLEKIVKKYLKKPKIEMS